MARPIYMDCHATTPVDPRVLEAMLPYFTEKFGNAASRTHSFGWAAQEGCEKARDQVSRLLGSRPKEIVFTSGATESNNLAIRGIVEFCRRPDAHLVTAATEHPSVLDPCRALQKLGRVTVTILAVDAFGAIDPAAVRAAIRPETVLVSIMHANNEIGTIHPLAEIAAVTRKAGVPLHVDATQSVGKLPIDVEATQIDLLSLSSHKFYGPKGCGALYVRAREPRIRLSQQMDGGGHERGMRSGTLNVPGIVGMGEACEIAGKEMVEEQTRVAALRDRLLAGIKSGLEGVERNGHPTRCLAGNLNLSFEAVEAESVLMSLRDIALSSGSACTSATLEPSHVLRALGLSEDRAESSLRFGLGRFNTEEDVDETIRAVIREVTRLRGFSARWGTRRRAAAS